MRCWHCGVEPERLHEITSFGSAEPEYLPEWPRDASDHEHAERPPTPAQLEQAGHDALMLVIGS